MAEFSILFGDETIKVTQAEEDTILRAALRSGIGFPYECNSGGCGSCKFQLVDGEVDNLWPDAPGLSPRDRKRNLLLACQCRAKTDIQIKARLDATYRPPIEPRRRKARLAAISDITHDIREFRFDAEGEADFLPGQYAMLDIPGVGTPRAYSMSNNANSKGEWHFQIRRVPGGKATSQLFDHIRVGDEIELDAPFGLAWLRTETTRHLACIAGGSGLAPMISIARGASAAGLLTTRQLHFFYGGRTPIDICGEQQLAAMPEFGNSIFYHPIISQAEDNYDWTGERGFVHELLEKKIKNELDNFDFYLAGPPPMTKSALEFLVIESKIPHDRIHFDRFY